MLYKHVLLLARFYKVVNLEYLIKTERDGVGVAYVAQSLDITDNCYNKYQ